MAGEMGSEPKRNWLGELEEGQIYGKDMIRPHEQKYLDHYESQWAKAKANLIGFHPEDRELMFEFLDRAGMYGRENNKLKNGNFFEMPYEDKILAKKVIRLEEEIDKRAHDLEKRIRVDSGTGMPSQLDKYPKDLLSKKERKELSELKRRISNSKSYLDMEDDQNNLYSNRRRLERQERRKKEGKEIHRPVEEYKSLFGFDPTRDPRPSGKDPREYEGEAPSMYDLQPEHRKGFYSQYQKPKVGMMERIMYKLRGGDEALIK